MRSFPTLTEFNDFKRQCGNKRRHPTRERAARARLEMAVRRCNLSLVVELQIYQCPHCNYHHLGRRKRQRYYMSYSLENSEKSRRKRLFQEALAQPRHQPRVLP